MPKTCKIEQLGLSDTVQSLMAEGITTRAEMTERLQSDYGADLSEATVGRYMARIRSAAQDEAFHKIQDHVNRVVPDDLDALEEMEKMVLGWSREAGASHTERVAAAAERISGEFPKWRQQMDEATDPEKQRGVIRWMIKQTCFYIQEDDRRQEQRLAAMRMAHKIIETKLSKAGLLDDDQKGRIVFLTRQAAGEDDPDNAGKRPPVDGKRRLRLVREEE